MGIAVVVDGQLRSGDWLRRHGLRRCYTCDEAKPVGEFIGARGRKCERCQVGVRTCRICLVEQPRTEYGYRRTTCNSCLTIPGDRHPRACLRCRVVKPVTDFPLGDGKLKSVCTACRDAETAEQAAREQARAAKRNQWADPITSVLTRRCTECGHVGPCEEDFYVCTRNPDGSVKRFASFCKTCQTARTRAYTESVNADPDKRRQFRAQRAAWSRKWRADNPEKSAASQRTYRTRREADPTLYAQDLENRRIDRRVRRERNGLTVRDHAERTTPLTVLPIEPFACWLDEVYDLLGVVESYARLSDEMGSYDVVTREELAERFGCSVRRLHAVRARSQRHISVGIVDKAITSINTVITVEVGAEVRTVVSLDDLYPGYRLDVYPTEASRITDWTAQSEPVPV